jgi:hypothetical protein
MSIHKKENSIMECKPLVVGSLVMPLLCFFEAVIPAYGSASQRQVSEGWPELFGERKLYACEYGFVYAGKKSGAEQAGKIVEAVTKDLREDGITKPARGLILVMDNGEKPPFEAARLIEALSRAETLKSDGESRDILGDMAEAKKQLEKAGLDMDTMLSIVPIPIAPAMLNEMAEEFPENVDQQVDYCIIIPTDRCFNAGINKMIGALLKKEKVGFMKRFAVRAVMRLMEKKVTKQAKNEQQAVLYQLLLDIQKDLPKEQKEKMAKAYKQKLGLENESKVDSKKNGKEETEAEQKEKS